MSLAGFKKQLNKANQMLTEKMGGAKGTELDHDFLEMERKIDVCGRLIEEVVGRTHEFLQPNPASRAKLSTMNTFQKLQGKASSSVYPQPEGNLGECMLKHGKDLGEDSTLGGSLIEAGESFRSLAEIKYALEDSVRQNFLEPLTSLQNRELKEINHHRKKLQSRRLDFDCKKRKQDKGARLPEEEMRTAEEKFEESKSLAENAMVNFLESDVEHTQALTEFVAAEIEYHRQAVDILEELHKKLEEKRREAESKPRAERRSVRKSSWEGSVSSSGPGSAGPGSSAPWESGVDGGSPTKVAFSMKPKHEGQANQVATCRALYDFVADNPTELPFAEGDVIRLIRQVDENWFFGELKGKEGHFPVNYVEVLVALQD